MITEFNPINNIISSLNQFTLVKKNTLFITYNDLNNLTDEDKKMLFILTNNNGKPISSSQIIYDHKQDNFLVNISIYTGVLYDNILENILTTLSVILTIFKQPFDNIQDVSVEIKPDKYQIINIPKNVTKKDFDETSTEITKYIRKKLNLPETEINEEVNTDEQSEL